MEMRITREQERSLRRVNVFKFINSSFQNDTTTVLCVMYLILNTQENLRRMWKLCLFFQKYDRPVVLLLFIHHAHMNIMLFYSSWVVLMSVSVSAQWDVKKYSNSVKYKDFFSIFHCVPYGNSMNLR